MAPADAGARIRLQRRPHYNGKLLTWTVMVDGREAGRIRAGGTLELPVAPGPHAALKAEAERTIARRYSASAEERQSFEEEVTLTIAAGIRSQVVFSWREIRQSGTVVLASDGATKIDVAAVS